MVMAVLRKPKLKLGMLGLVCAVALAAPAAVLALTLVGTAKPDLLRGSSLADRIFGLGANDRLYGFAGNDLIVGGPGKDKMFGGPGNDRLEARDGQRDLVDCGPGNDTAIVDKIDTVKACETVQLPGKCQGCRSNPIRVGVSHDIGRGWSVKVKSVLPNATSRILQYDRTNNPPRPNHQFYMVTLEAKRTGKTPGYLHAGYHMRAVGPSGNEYSTYDDSCGSIPDPDLETDDRRIYHNTTISGNICWQVLSSDAPRLVMVSAPGKQIYFSLNS
jgi:hypothetical protein